MNEVATVTEVRNRQVIIAFHKQNACGSCRLGALCGRGNERIAIDAGNFQLEKGDSIEIQIDEKKNLLASVITFFVPSVVFIGILLLTRTQPELVSFSLALGAICVYYGILKVCLRRVGKKFHIAIVRKVEPQERSA